MNVAIHRMQTTKSEEALQPTLWYTVGPTCTPTYKDCKVATTDDFLEESVDIHGMKGDYEDV